MCWARVTTVHFRMPMKLGLSNFCLNLTKRGEEHWIVSKGHAVFLCPGIWIPSKVWSLQVGSHSVSLTTSYFLGRPDVTANLHDLASLPSLACGIISTLLWSLAVAPGLKFQDCYVLIPSWIKSWHPWADFVIFAFSNKEIEAWSIFLYSILVSSQVPPLSSITKSWLPVFVAIWMYPQECFEHVSNSSV